MDFWTKWMKLLKVCSNFLPIQWDFHWRKTICSTENHYKCLYSLCLTDQSHSSKLLKTDEEATSREDRDKEYEEWKQKIIESATKSLSAGKKTVEKQKSWVVIVLSAGRKTSPCPWLPKVDPSSTFCNKLLIFYHLRRKLLCITTLVVGRFSCTKSAGKKAHAWPRVNLGRK